MSKDPRNSCSSGEFIDHVMGLKGSDEFIVNNAALVRKSYDKPIEFFRTIDGFRDTCGKIDLVDWDKMQKSQTMEDGENISIPRIMRSINCHNGQVKLALGLLYFLNTSSVSKGDHLLYVGASTFAASIASIAYPDLPMTLFDANEDVHKQMIRGFEHTVVKNINEMDESTAKDVRALVVQAFYEDETLDQLYEKSRLSKGTRVLFVSDIRIDTGDENVEKDMISQMRWAQESAAKHSTRGQNPARCMLKYRVPYDDAKKSFEYLAGDLHIQAYPPAASTELRLVCEANKDGEYSVEEHDGDYIEKMCIAFQTFWRSHAMFCTKGCEAGRYDEIMKNTIIRESPMNRERIANHIDRKLASSTLAECGLKQFGNTQKRYAKDGATGQTPQYLDNPTARMLLGTCQPQPQTPATPSRSPYRPPGIRNRSPHLSPQKRVNEPRRWGGAHVLSRGKTSSWGAAIPGLLVLCASALSAGMRA